MTFTSIRLRSEETELRAGLPIMRFETASAFDAWLLAEPRASKGIWLKLAKKSAAIAGISKPDAIDAALCHSWIDGQQDKYDADNWLVRFTPRRRASRWLQINRTRALELIAAGRMHPAGLAEITAARSEGRWDAAYAPASTAVVPPDLREALDASPEAASFFAKLKGSHRYAILYGIGLAKMPVTRARRVAQFVTMLERHELRIGSGGGT